MGDIGVVYAFDDKTGQGRLWRAEHAHTFPVSQATQQVLVQAGLMPFDGVGIEIGEVIERRAKADDAGNRRRTGLETQRCRAETGAVIIGQLHHLAAKLPVAQQLKRL
ncbi:hypothetical protein D3C71_1779230 [compost metagenome]